MPENNPAQALNETAVRNGWAMRVDTTLRFNAPQLNALRDLWRAKAEAARGLPPRSAFDARTLKPFLSHISIVERAVNPQGRTSYRFRFYGTELVRYFGEQTGQFIENFIPEDRLERWISGYDAVLAGDSPIRFLSYFEMPHVSFINGESLSAPIFTGEHPPNTILAATYFTPKSIALADTA